MVVEAVDRILWITKRRTPLTPGQPLILDEVGLGCSGTEDALPVTTVQALDQHTLRVTDHIRGASLLLRRGQINKEGLRVESDFPIITAALGISTKVEWRPSEKPRRR